MTDVTVVCAGVKSILDIGATLEYLETAGVPVVTFGADQFPAFYSRESGFAADCRVDDPAKIAAMMKSKTELGLRGGMLVAGGRNSIREDGRCDPAGTCGVRGEGRARQEDYAVPAEQGQRFDRRAQLGGQHQTGAA